MSDDSKEQLTCSICQRPIPSQGSWLEGNNAQPVNDGRCCNECNDRIVIPARLTRMMAGKSVY